MSLGEQWRKIKDNWLLIVVPFVLLFLVFGGLGSVGSLMSESFADSSVSSDVKYSGGAPSAMSRSFAEPMIGGGFAPSIVDRLIARSASLSSEVDRGGFDDAVSQLRSIVETSDAYVLNEEINRHDDDFSEYQTGSFGLKIASDKYDALTAQLKRIGEVQSFTEDAEDVTGFHEDLSIRLAGERERLARYEAMYAEAKDVDDKIQLSDRIFNQESLIKNLESGLQELDQRVSYSTISVYLREEQSDFAGISFVGFGELVAGFVSSLSGLLSFVVVVLPWAVAAWLVRLVWRRLRGKKR